MVIVGDGTASHQVVIASRQQWGDVDGALQAVSRLVETSTLSQQIAEQIERHGVGRVERQRLAKYLFGFGIAILGQECPCLAEAAEAGLGSARRGPAEAADGFVAMAERVDQGAGAKPGPCQRGGAPGGRVVAPE